MNFFKSNSNQSIYWPQILWLLLVVTIGAQAQQHEHDASEEMEAQGPHNGRLLQADDFTVELAIFEQGIPPEFRAWAREHSEPIDQDDWQLEVKLTRLGGEVTAFDFIAKDDYLLGIGEVSEPHSFDVEISAEHKGKTYTWHYESHEGRTRIDSEIASQLGIKAYSADSGIIHQSVLLYGKISPDPQQISHISARFPGMIETVLPALGDEVSQGELIATIEANDSLQSYDIRAPINGIVVDRHANPGEYAGTQTLLTIANYRDLWADLVVFPGDAQRIKAGQTVEIQLGDQHVQSSIRYLNLGEGNTPQVIARVPLPNPELLWTPGLLIEAQVTVAQFEVPLVVDKRALQTFRDWQVVYIQLGDEYEIRPLQLGRSDTHFSEVLDGLNPGDRYVVENSYLLKADVEKSGASHNH